MNVDVHGLDDESAGSSNKRKIAVDARCQLYLRVGTIKVGKGKLAVQGGVIKPAGGACRRGGRWAAKAASASSIGGMNGAPHLAFGWCP